VQLCEGAALSEASLLAFLEDRLTGYKMPKSIEFVDEAMRDEAGKVRRSALRAARVASAPAAS
jgi:bile acid-coenzyme A ligase